MNSNYSLDGCASEWGGDGWGGGVCVCVWCVCSGVGKGFDGEDWLDGLDGGGDGGSGCTLTSFNLEILIS